jgi:thiamine-phosphate pyrophosphorylase
MAAPEEPLLCLVTDRHRSAGRPVEEIVEAAVKGGVGLVQLREKDLPAVELFNLATRLRDITAGRAALYINDRVDVAVAVGADGVQLGQQGMPVAAARRVVGDGLKIGRSVHDVVSGVQSAEEGADLLVVGTIFPTESHPNVDAQGTDILADLRSLTDVPIVAIGGITRHNIGSVIQAGASGAAVVSAITLEPHPEQAATRLMSAMRRASSPTGLTKAAVQS